MTIVIPASSAEGRWAKAIAERLRNDEETGLGLARNEKVCPVCKLVFTTGPGPGSLFGVCPDDWQELNE